MDEIIDLNDANCRDKIAETIGIEMDDFCDQVYDDGFRTHLGASSIGNSCARKSFYAFRWAKTEVVNEGCPKHTKGQMRRLHQRGHLEEHLIWKYLRGIGFTIWDTNPETGKQWLYSASNGHHGGSCDALGKLPEKYKCDDLLVVECKTANDTSWRRMEKDGLILNKPEHHAQMSAYGKQFGAKWGLYICVNKNNDKIYIELIKIDMLLGENMLKKADEIINCDPTLPPAKVAMQPTNFHCKFCSFKAVCHYEEQVDKNCRSCIHSVPVADKKWHCKKYNYPLTDELIKTGCQEHEGLQ